MQKMEMGETKDIPLSQLTIGVSQARTSGVNKGIDELAESIKKVGLLEPISVYQIADDEFEIIAGQRRFLACQSLGMSSIRATVLLGNLDEESAKAISLTENMMRESMTQKDLIDVCTYLYRQYDSIKIVCEQTGLPYGKVQGYVKFDRLTPELKELVTSNDVDMKSALRAQDAATGEDGKVNVQDAVELAKGMSGMPGIQQEDVMKARQRNPKASAGSVLEEAKSGKRKQIIVTIGPVLSDGLERYAKSEQVTLDDAAGILIAGGLEEKGFLGSGE